MSKFQKTVDKYFWLWLISLIVSGGLVSYILQFTAWPEMLTYPWLMGNGYSLYSDIIHPYLPLLPYLLLGIFKLFGFSIASLHFVTVFVFAVCTLLIGLIAKKKTGNFGGLIAVSVFTFLYYLYHGNGLWFDLVSIPFVLGTYLLLIDKSQTRHKNIVAFLLIGLAILIKQTNVFFVLPALMTLKPKRPQIILALWTLVPLGLVVSIYALTPQFKDFLYWGIWHPLFVHGRMPGFALFPSIRELIQLIFILIPLSLPFAYRKQMLVWIGVSLILAFPRFADFHLLQLIAFMSISIAVIVQQQNRKIVKLLITGYLCGIMLLFLRFASHEIGLPTRFFEPEVEQVRTELVKQIPLGKKVLFLNVPANYFVMTSVFPSKPWSDTFPWYLEVPGVQDKVIQSLEKIDYVVYSPFSSDGTFALGSYTPQTISAYVQKYFKLSSQISPQIQILTRF